MKFAVEKEWFFRDEADMEEMKELRAKLVTDLHILDDTKYKKKNKEINEMYVISENAITNPISASDQFDDYVCIRLIKSVIKISEDIIWRYPLNSEEKNGFEAAQNTLKKYVVCSFMKPSHVDNFF